MEIFRDLYFNASDKIYTATHLCNASLIRVNFNATFQCNLSMQPPNHTIESRIEAFNIPDFILSHQHYRCAVEISVRFFDGLKIKSKGYVDAKLTILWDKGREVYRKRIKIC